MRSLLFAILYLAAGLATQSTDGFMKPRDPVMDQVAKILTGILNNLQKHHSLISASQAVTQAKVPADQRDQVRALLAEELSKIEKGEKSDLLSGHTHDKAALLGVVSELQAPEAKTIRELAKVPAGVAATVLFVDTSCEKYSEKAEAVVTEAGAKAIVVDASKITAPGLVDRTPEMYFVPADGSLPRRFESQFTKGMVETFVKDTTPGQPDERRVLIAEKHNTTKASTVPEVSSKQIFAMMERKTDDLFVVFYSPNCGHCVQFVMNDNAPLQQLHDELNDRGAIGENSLTVVKMDVSNWPELPPVFPAIEYIPAVFFVPADRKTLVPYESGYDVPAILGFLAEHSKAAKEI